MWWVGGQQNNGIQQQKTVDGGKPTPGTYMGRVALLVTECAHLIHVHIALASIAISDALGANLLGMPNSDCTKPTPKQGLKNLL
jgi:hypothetical protein